MRPNTSSIVNSVGNLKQRSIYCGLSQGYFLTPLLLYSNLSNRSLTLAPAGDVFFYLIAILFYFVLVSVSFWYPSTNTRCGFATPKTLQHLISDGADTRLAYRTSFFRVDRLTSTAAAQ